MSKFKQLRTVKYEPLLSAIRLLRYFARHNDDSALAECQSVRSANVLVQVRPVERNNY